MLVSVEGYGSTAPLTLARRPGALELRGPITTMRTSPEPQTRASRCLTALDSFFQNGWVKFLGLPAFQVLPLAIIALMASGISDASGFLGWLQPYAKSYPLLGTFITGLVVILISALAQVPAHVIARSKGVVAGRDYMTLFEVLERVVGVKAERFEDWAGRAADPRGLSAEQIFENITQPQEQIKLIWEGLHTFYSSIASAESVAFEVYAAPVADGAIADWDYCCPWGASPKIAIDDARKRGNPVSGAVESKRPVIIEDMTARVKLGRKRIGAPLHDEEGSAICYPVVSDKGRSVIYIVVVVADKKGYFSKKRKALYDWIFGHFKVRVSLEHSLFILKAKGRTHEADAERQQGGHASKLAAADA